MLVSLSEYKEEIDAYKNSFGTQQRAVVLQFKLTSSITHCARTSLSSVMSHYINFLYAYNAGQNLEHMPNLYKNIGALGVEGS